MPTIRSVRMLLVAVLVISAVGLESTATAQDRPVPPQPDAQRPPRADRAAQRPAADAMRWIENIEIVQDVVYATVKDAEGNERELQLDAAFPKQGGDKPLPAVIYIHGGGWSGGSRNAGHPFTIAFANGGYFACTISYRLSGEATYPAAVHDCKAAVRFLRANAEQLGIDPNRIGVWGHSAGGHLSAMIGLTGDNSAFDGNVGTTGVACNVACFVDVSGPSALAGWMDNGMVAEFLGGEGEERMKRAEEASPVNHVDKNDPPALIVHGTKDELVSVRQAHILHNKMQEVGASSELHLVEGGTHGIREKSAYEAIAAFFDNHLGGNVSKVMAEVDWNRLNQMQPPSPPRAPEAPDAPRPQRRPNADRSDAPARDATTIPEPLTEEQVNAMSGEEAREAMTKVARAMRNASELDQETRNRLRTEFRWLRDRVRETGD